MKEFKRILIANRGEIALRIIRAVQELGMKAICIYSEEDRLSLYRSKADEAYLLPEAGSPTDAYLNIKNIIDLAKRVKIDAIHPGYGFLSENNDFARECNQSGIKFIGPDDSVINLLGNKVNAKNAAKRAGVSVLEGKKIENAIDAKRVAEEIELPIIIKASAGGGGRGMRVVESMSEIESSYESAVREAIKAFANGEVFIEKFVKAPRHVEVQILADEHGNMVHLYERDCSIQRRHQKLVEFSPCQSITEQTRKNICDDALKIAKEVGYTNAGTVEFLIDDNENHYFMEVNPRIQVEHTVTELVCNLDIVQAQILIAQGLPLSHEEIGINSQNDIEIRGAAIECRVTTENVLNNFMPDTGRIDVYKTGSGPGIRLDGGNGFTGSVISPYFDSLLVKTTSYDRSYEKARRKMVRALREHAIEGVSTNKDFLINVLEHEEFKKGTCDTSFIETHPELFNLDQFDNHEYKLLKYIGETTLKRGSNAKTFIDRPGELIVPNKEDKAGTKQILDEQGVKGLIQWVKEKEELLFMDTTMRDGHQSLFATKLRTADLLKVANAISNYEKDLFSLELWGGATFDVAYRFLKESPWERLHYLRKLIPNIMFQMLIRGANAVGYKNYPDNVITEFIKRSADAGIDVFRIFDSLNWLDQISPALEEVKKQGKIAEVALCYTGDILDKSRTKYDLKYYLRKAKEIENMGADILAIKDMSGLLKPAAALELTKALKDTIDIPLHMHTHDTSGNGVSSMLMSSIGGADIVDGAISAMSGVTSQPSLNSIVAALEHTPRESSLKLDELEKINEYYEDARKAYFSFESGLTTGTTQIYKYEVPGGQYSNLKTQVDSFGLGHRFTEVLEKYKEANDILGDIIKVTPTSKVVGDLAIFMLQNNLNKENIYRKGKDLAFPDSVIDYFQGMIGQPEGGFDEELRDIVLKGAKYITERPGLLLPDENFDSIKAEYKEKFDVELNDEEVISAALYPKVFEDYIKFKEEYGDLTYMDTDVFFSGLAKGEEVDIEYSRGKKVIVKLIRVSKVDKEGFRHIIFEVDGFRRDLYLEDTHTIMSQIRQKTKMAEENNEKQIGSPIPGNIIKINVQTGDTIKKNQSLIVVEAMKMETEVASSVDGIVKEIYVDVSETVKAGQLLIELE